MKILILLSILGLSQSAFAVPDANNSGLKGGSALDMLNMTKTPEFNNKKTSKIKLSTTCKTADGQTVEERSPEYATCLRSSQTNQTGSIQKQGETNVNFDFGSDK